MDQHTEYLSESHMRRLADDPKNLVYEYKFDEVDRVKPMEEVERLLRQTIAVYSDFRKQNPDWCDRHCKLEILKKYPELKDFCETHPRYFKMATNRSTTGEELKNLYLLVQVRSLVEKGKMTEDQAKQYVMSTMLEKCKMNITPEELYKQREAQGSAQ
jgi:hypothetical protein